MNIQELNEKMLEIIDAVRKVQGIQISSVDFDACSDSFLVLTEVVPKIVNLELIVKIGLKLEVEGKKEDS